MRKVLVALVCTSLAVACGESRPAEDPSTARSTTITTTSAARPTTESTPTTSTPTIADSNATRGVRPAQTSENADPMRSPKWDAPSGAVTTGTPSSAPNVPSGGATTGVAPSTANPGAANDTKDADNTKINDRDRHGTVTPMDQGGGKDRDITAAIRRAVMGDSALSFTAKNVKIITTSGKVTLRGPVKSDQEKVAIEAKAKSTAGVSEVDNQLEVKK